MARSFEKKYWRAALFMGVVTFLGSCAAGSLPEEGSPDVALFRNKCTVCHSWPHPRRHNTREWDHYLKLMEGHMKNREISIERQDMETIRAYLHRNARQD
ncbi:MAG: cytochrome C [Nitrospinota bacterium]|nr:cytochrome C [Nitrospinota bacterium]